MRILASVPVAAFWLVGASAALAADLYTPPTDPVPDSPHAFDAMVSLYGGGAYLTSGDEDFTNVYGEFGVDARLGSDHWILETAAAYQSRAGSRDIEDRARYGSFYFMGAGHLIKRNPGNAFGAFGGMIYTTFQEDSENSAIGAFGGLEGAVHHGNHSIYGQIGLAHAYDGDSPQFSWRNGAFGRIGARYFLSDDSLVAADFMVTYGEFDNPAEGENSNDKDWGFAWGLEYEHRLHDSWSGALYYEGHAIPECCDQPIRAFDHVVGVRFSFDLDATTLKHRYRDGVGLFSSPDFQRYFAWPDEL